MPKIVFKYSWYYDQMIHDYWPRPDQEYPSSKQILQHIPKVEKLWNKNGNKILKELSKISGLKWHSKIIYCYIVGYCIPFCDPLTMPICIEYPSFFIDNLIHELIHDLFFDGKNEDRTEKAFKYFNKKYKKETLNTRIHIPLHAIHTHMYLNFFHDKKRLDRDFNLIRHLPDYRRSWEIVKKEGYKNIINEFREKLI